MSDPEEIYLVPFIHQQLKSLAKEVSVKEWALRAGIPEASLKKMLSPKFKSNSLSFVKVTLLFEVVSIPIEYAIALALADFQRSEVNLNFMARLTPRESFTLFKSQHLYRAIISTLEEYMLTERNGICSCYRLAPKVGMRGGHLARYFATPSQKKFSQSGHLGILKLVKIARAFDTNLPALIGDAKKKAFNARSFPLAPNRID
jgi:hypothetical protein